MDELENARRETTQRLAKLLEEDPRLAVIKGVFDVFPGAEWFVVGGAVRDAALGRGGERDYDLMVRLVELEALAEALRPLGEVNFVGRRFGVLKFRPAGATRDIDIAWPRTERAGMSGGYRDFEVQADPALSVERDLARRDFTVNAMAWNMRTGELVDPFGGMRDLAARSIRAVGEAKARLGEDYSRMLRGIRFACELGFEIEPSTRQAILQLAPHVDDQREHEGREERVVPIETVAKEFLKAMAADARRAVALFEESGLLFRMIPELVPLASCAQSPEHHSEGDVWTHTKLALEKLSGTEFARLFPGERASVETAVAVLLHDVAKPLTATKGDDGRITFYGHAEEGAAMAARIAERLRLASYPGAGVDVGRLAFIVKMHLFPNIMKIEEVKRTTLVKHFLTDRVAGRELLQVACADACASVRPEGGTDLANLERLIVALGHLESRVGSEHLRSAIISGSEVMATAGIGPGPDVGRIMEALQEAQLTGKVTTAEEAKEFLKGLHAQE